LRERWKIWKIGGVSYRSFYWEIALVDWVVAVSPEESANGQLAPDADGAARSALEEHGCVLLRGAFPRPTIEAMHREYMAQFGALDITAMAAEAAKPPPNRFLKVGHARYDMTLRMTGGFGSTETFANPLLLKFLRPLLGDEMRLSNYTLVVSHPGAAEQHVHRDHEHLFLQPGVGPNLPVYAVNVAVPLVDVDLAMGPTGIWLGSHRSANETNLLRANLKADSWRRGDCVLLDYRTWHAGLPNLSDQARPVVYMVYARPWFFDDVNHINRLSMDMPLEDYEALPEEVRKLLIRAFSYATRSRWQQADSRGPAARVGGSAPRQIPLRGKVGRNDPCPCGSGRKFKQCHGRAAA
jgi:Phytanoyl-CoA dioxygenase (PhyH)/SEC-C motif